MDELMQLCYEYVIKIYRNNKNEKPNNIEPDMKMCKSGVNFNGAKRESGNHSTHVAAHFRKPSSPS
jgi:hypothetical protein